jgi:adenine-specific DNA-methyltransferase
MKAGRKVARALAQEIPKEPDRLAFAQAFCFEVISTLWICLQTDHAEPWLLPRPFVSIGRAELPAPVQDLAHNMGRAASRLDLNDAGYLVGITYTSLLPAAFRSKHGAYYTPPALVHRLLAMAGEAGVNWATCRALDPACGGGAFLAPLAQHIVREQDDDEPTKIIEAISSRLRGFEKDPFGAWMSQVFLEIATLDISHAARRRLPRLVEVCDSLGKYDTQDRFDLVIGNPPYGRVGLTPEKRAIYKRGLFGHANLYGLFTDLALRLARPGAVVAYVTPTSFLSGEYFKALRGLLAEKAPPLKIVFISERKGVFEDVLQETSLATYRLGEPASAGIVDFISYRNDASPSIAATSSFVLPDDPVKPWVLPREPRQVPLAGRMRHMPHRLSDYGYTVSTGPLVWNRHKNQLRDRPGKNCYPLIWGEAVTPAGEFVFQARKRSHKPYFRLQAGDDWLITRETCVLLQRTTAKEQRRRLIAAELPVSMIQRCGAVVIENHLNMIRKRGGDAPPVPVQVLTALLNSETVDQAFRCINGSVAVSAFELEALPLPSPDDTRPLEALVRNGTCKSKIEKEIRRLYLGNVF